MTLIHTWNFMLVGLPCPLQITMGRSGQATKECICIILSIWWNFKQVMYYMSFFSSAWWKNVGWEFNLANLQFSVGSTNFKLPKYLQTKVYSYSCTTAASSCCEKLWKCLDSPGRTIPRSVLANLCTLTWSVVIVPPLFGGTCFHTQCIMSIFAAFGLTYVSEWNLQLSYASLSNHYLV